MHKARPGHWVLLVMVVVRGEALVKNGIIYHGKLIMHSHRGHVISTRRRIEEAEEAPATLSPHLKERSGDAHDERR